MFKFEQIAVFVVRQ